MSLCFYFYLFDNCRKNKLKGFGGKNKQGGLKDGERMIMKEK
jgi:hypothetical protein